ncbi:MAG: glycosyltransferase, partial [bacterium]|nr:glycosyltransferase [bacterium]
PLPDDPWTRGKGGYKLLQYLSMGIPAVASPVGVNREIVTDGVHGFWASNSAEWVGCLERLVEDASLRRALGGAGRRKVEACYSLERSNRHLLQILESVAGGQG